MVQHNLLPKKVTRDELNSLIDKAADLIRTAVDYKFILVLLFLKRLNDLGKSERLQVKERLMKETGLSEKEAEDEADKFEYTFKIPKQFLWDAITKDVKNLPERLATAISEIAKLNKELQGVINRVDFLEFARNEENRELLRQLVELFNKYELNGELSPNILGDAYEHILMRFAPQKAKEGEIYTPREVIKLIVEILDPEPGESVYDPCCGSGGMLTISYVHVAEEYGKEEAGKLFLYGQERSPEIYAVGQMDLLLHGIQNANLANGDTLDYPRFGENGKLKQFDIVIANPPWNQSGYGEERLKKADFRERFSFGYTPGSKGADWAWIQHMLASVKENGRVGVVIDNVCLSKGSVHKAIRSKIIDKDFIESIILLPEKLFYNTGAPGAIIVFNKKKLREKERKILFINASNEYVPHPSVRRLNSLSKENIKKIVTAYRQFSEDSGFSKIVDIKEIVENDYNLNVTTYVMSIEEKEKIDVPRKFVELENLTQEKSAAEKKLRQLLGDQMQDKRFKKTNVGIIPEHWEIVKIGGILSLEYGKGLPERQRIAGKYPVVGSNGVVGYHNQALVKGPGIVVGRKGTIGAISWIDQDFWPIDTTYYVKTKTDKICLKWLFYELVHLDPSRLNLSDVVPGLKRELVHSLWMPLPPLQEQLRIAETLSAIDKTIELEKHEQTVSGKIKRGLMESLLRGKNWTKAD